MDTVIILVVLAAFGFWGYWRVTEVKGRDCAIYHKAIGWLAPMLLGPVGIVIVYVVYREDIPEENRLDPRKNW
jgi:hypothetical protein